MDRGIQVQAAAKRLEHQWKEGSLALLLAGKFQRLDRHHVSHHPLRLYTTGGW